jgi:hypothetical protein
MSWDVKFQVIFHFDFLVCIEVVYVVLLFSFDISPNQFPTSFYFDPPLPEQGERA